MGSESVNGLLEWWILLGFHNLWYELALVDKYWVEGSNLVGKIGYPYKCVSNPLILTANVVPEIVDTVVVLI